MTPTFREAQSFAVEIHANKALAVAYRKRAEELRRIIAQSKQVCFLCDMALAVSDDSRAKRLESGEKIPPAEFAQWFVRIDVKGRGQA